VTYNTNIAEKAMGNLAQETHPAVFESLTAPVGPVPFETTQSGHFYDLPGRPYEAPPSYESIYPRSEASATRASTFQPPHNSQPQGPR